MTYTIDVSKMDMQHSNICCMACTHNRPPPASLLPRDPPMKAANKLIRFFSLLCQANLPWDPNLLFCKMFTIDLSTEKRNKLKHQQFSQKSTCV